MSWMAAFPPISVLAPPEIEEERRLLYVAMTRAKDQLHLVVPQRFLTHAQRNLGDGPLAPIACASRTAYRPCHDCKNPSKCSIRITMAKVRDAMSQVLDNQRRR